MLVYWLSFSFPLFKLDSKTESELRGDDEEDYAMSSESYLEVSLILSLHLKMASHHGDMVTKKLKLKVTLVKTWQRISRKETQSLVKFLGSERQAIADCKGFISKH